MNDELRRTMALEEISKQLAELNQTLKHNKDFATICKYMHIDDAKSLIEISGPQIGLDGEFERERK